MHTRASNSELVEPLPEPERTLNRRRCRRNIRVPFSQRNNPPKNSRIVYPPILDINHFRHFLVTLENIYPMDDEPMWAADRVVALTLGSAITILETANEFAIKGNIIKIIYHGLSEITQEVLNAAAGGIFLYKTPNQAYQLLKDKVLLKLDWAKNQKTKSSLKKTIAFADEGSSNSDTDKIMARMDAMTLKMDAQYKELQSNDKKTKPDLNEDDIPMSREEEFKFMQTFSIDQCFHQRNIHGSQNPTRNRSQKYQASIQNLEIKFDRLADNQSGRPFRSLPGNSQPNLKGHSSKAYQPPQSRNDYVNAVFTRSGKSYNPLVNPNDQQTNSETPINFDSDDEEDEEPTPQPKTQNLKPAKATPLPIPYKPKILYPQCLRK
ncbi:hypothetical protein Tco_0333307 [Tanacetum coccineum]